MRRIVMAIATALALALAVPGMAFAAHHRGARHSGRHHRHHRAHGARVVKFTTSDTTGEGKAGEGATETTPEGVGTVVSFKGEVLTIKLNDGSEVSGKVTEDTRLLCMSSTPSQSTDDNVGGGDDESGDSSEHGGEGSAEGTTEGEGDHSSGSLSGTQDSSFEGGGDSSDDDQGSVQSCETSALEKEGTVVREAELRITSSGAVWESVVLA